MGKKMQNGILRLLPEVVTAEKSRFADFPQWQKAAGMNFLRYPRIKCVHNFGHYRKTKEKPIDENNTVPESQKTGTCFPDVCESAIMKKNHP